MLAIRGASDVTLVSLRNENGKEAIGLDKQNNNFARASRFLYISLPVVARQQRETASRFVEDGNKRQQLSFLFLNFDVVL